MTEPAFKPPVEPTHLHVKGYGSTADEVHGNHPICSWCEKSWPCEGAALEAEVSSVLKSHRRMFERWMKEEARADKLEQCLRHIDVICNRRSTASLKLLSIRRKLDEWRTW